MSYKNTISMGKTVDVYKNTISMGKTSRCHIKIRYLWGKPLMSYKNTISMGKTMSYKNTMSYH